MELRRKDIKKYLHELYNCIALRGGRNQDQVHRPLRALGGHGSL